jgi:hypothetical protein
MRGRVAVLLDLLGAAVFSEHDGFDNHRIRGTPD